MHRYWFVFESDPSPNALNLGCGVTARDMEDALTLLRERVFVGRSLPTVVSVTEDVDISSLDQTHIVPNMHPPHVRGIWFPKGFDRKAR